MTTIKPGIISEEASEWDQMTLDRKLDVLAHDLDIAFELVKAKMPGALPMIGMVSDRLEECSDHVFEYMRDTGETI